MADSFSSGLDTRADAALRPIVEEGLASLGRTDDEAVEALMTVAARAYNRGWMRGADEMAGQVASELGRRGISLNARILLPGDLTGDGG